MKEIKSEKDFLTLIDRHFPAQNGHVTLGRGDDCSIVSTGTTLCLSKDLFIEGVHFRRSYFGPGDIGYKSLAVNISDIAAMGGNPQGFELGLIIPEGLDTGFWDEFFQSMAFLASEHDMILAGGDLSKGPCLGVSITVWGEPAPGTRFLSRGNAHPGDILFVHGQLGLARCGLLLLESEGSSALTSHPVATKAHLRPEMRVETGMQLARQNCVRGLMDVSDGLARDLPRFLSCSQEPCGADISFPDDFLHPEIVSYSGKNSYSARELIFMGGEDYALLGAASPDCFNRLKKDVRGLVKIGKVSEDTGIRLDEITFDKSGFDHFSE